MKWFILVLVSAIIGSISLGYIRPSASSSSSLEPIPPVSTKLFPDIRAQRIQILVQSGSVANWEVTAEDASLYNEGQLTVLHGVFLRYLRQASSLLQIKAARGQIDNVTGDIIVEGAIHLKYQDTYTIETEKIHWSALGHVIYTDRPVKIYNASFQMTGQELHGEMDSARIALEGNVQASFPLR
jgi:LPS export ABC transporter protein LptC